MILKALYDYYHRSDNLPAEGMEEKEIGFIIVLSNNGKFIRFEDCRIDKKHARTYLVKKHVERRAAVANYLYDNSSYTLGLSDRKELDKLKDEIANFENDQNPEGTFEKLKKEFENKQKECVGKEQKCFNTFKEKIRSIYNELPESQDIKAVFDFYEQGRDAIIEEIQKDPLWNEIQKKLSKKYSTFSFRIEGDTKIIAEKKELLQLQKDENGEGANLCLISGQHGILVETTTATMIPGSLATAKLVAFQVNSGYDSYGKTKCGNAPISKEAEFAYTTALNTMLSQDSHNKFRVGNRTFLFWASSKNEIAEQAEESLFDLLGFSDEGTDNPNAKVERVKKVFSAIYSGMLKTNLDDRFYILGLAPNSARLSVVYWSETSLKDFAGEILRHFHDMEVIDGRKEQHPYMGIKEMLSAVTLSGKQSEVTPNLPEAIIKSIFQGLPYPYTLFSACIRRIRAESGDKNGVRIGRIGILKAYLNRIKDNNKKIEVMLDKDNTNQGYLCGRLFAVLDRIQEDANSINSIRERYMNAASSTPASVFSTILNLSLHHMENLSRDGKKIFYEKLKQEIIDKISAEGFPLHLDLQDQGRFFVGYYHQKQEFYVKKEEKEENN